MVVFVVIVVVLHVIWFIVVTLKQMGWSPKLAHSEGRGQLEEEEKCHVMDCQNNSIVCMSP